MYARRGLLVDNYLPRRGLNNFYHYTNFSPLLQLLGRWSHHRFIICRKAVVVGGPLVSTKQCVDIRYLTNTSPGLPSIPTRRRLTERIDISGLLARLDCRDGAGLSEAEFRSVFVQCECGRITTRRVFNDHTCAAPVIIDLTSEADADDNFDISDVPIIIDLTEDSDDLQ